MRAPGGALLLAVFGAWLLTSCARRGTGSSWPSATIQLSGRIVLTGSEPTVEVTILSDSLGAVRIEGALVAELRALSGATVRITGRWAGFGTGPGVDVAAFDVLAIDGQRPNVGVLVRRGGSVWLAAADTLRLSSVPLLLEARIGAKVWIVGRRAAGALEVRSFGVIRDN